jgi:hypothetical protein
MLSTRLVPEQLSIGALAHAFAADRKEHGDD